jgi:hypothetical protein
MAHEIAAHLFVIAGDPVSQPCPLYGDHTLRNQLCSDHGQSIDNTMDRQSEVSRSTFTVSNQEGPNAASGSPPPILCSRHSVFYGPLVRDVVVWCKALLAVLLCLALSGP